MSYDSEISELVESGQKISQGLEICPVKTSIGGLQAGAYVGIAIILIMTLGASVPESVRPLIMGATFGLALILVVIGGAYLFTGCNMYTAVAVASDRMTVGKAIKVNVWIFFANLGGALILVIIYWLGEGALTHSESAAFVQSVSEKKMQSGAIALVAQGTLCNWLVCLALWMAVRVKSESAKCIVIAWCLLAFIAAGFEHSVANMTVHLLAMFGPENDGITLSGAAHNLIWVTLGNVIGGAIFVGLAYYSQADSRALSSPGYTPD